MRRRGGQLDEERRTRRRVPTARASTAVRRFAISRLACAPQAFGRSGPGARSCSMARQHNMARQQAPTRGTPPRGRDAHGGDEASIWGIGRWREVRARAVGCDAPFASTSRDKMGMAQAETKWAWHKQRQNGHGMRMGGGSVLGWRRGQARVASNTGHMLQKGHQMARVGDVTTSYRTTLLMIRGVAALCVREVKHGVGD